MMHELKNIYNRVSLVPIEEGDIEDLRILRNKESNWFVNPEQIDTESQKKWFKRYIITNNDFMFKVENLNNRGKLIGTVALYDYDSINLTAEFGRLLVDNESAGVKGLGYDTTICACKIGFEQLGLHKIVLEVFSDNIRAIKTYRKTGFINISEHNNMQKMILTKDEFYKVLKRNEENNMSIQVLKPKFHVDECLEEIRECLEKGWTGLGFKTVEFEKKWCEYTGHKNAHFLNSATVGLHLAVEILKKENGWQDGDEVITTPITFVSTNHAILYEKLVPRFADVDEYLCLDPVDVEKKINGKTKAIVFVGYGGRVGQLDKIIEICKKHGLKLILDAAHMTGTRVNGVFPGTFDGVDVAVYSYQAVKNLPTADSGMICFANSDYDQLCRKLTWLGINKDTYARSGDKGSYKWKYDVDYLGYKDHGNSIMAAIALVQLKYVDEDNIYRRKLADYYDQFFEDNENVNIIKAPYRDECSFHIYEIEVENRDGLMQALQEADIYAGVHYRDNTEYEMYSYDHGKCPNAHRISNRIITLPLHLELTMEDIEKIAGVVNEYTSQR